MLEILGHEIDHDLVTRREEIAGRNSGRSGERLDTLARERLGGLNVSQPEPRSSRLQVAALTPIGDAGRAEMIVDRLTGSIVAGAFAFGERLPSESELARLLGVSVVTVREALTTLRSAGLIETRRGRVGGSFVSLTRDDAELMSARTLVEMPRVTVADLGLHYEMSSASCAELACQRATDFELDVMSEILATIPALSRDAWRAKVTDIQLELASLSQSVRLTDEHVRIQSQYTPLLALQDADPEAREHTERQLAQQIEAIRDEDIGRARTVVREGIRRSTHWLIAFRQRLVAHSNDEDIRYELQNRGGSVA